MKAKSNLALMIVVGTMCVCTLTFYFFSGKAISHVYGAAPSFDQGIGYYASVNGKLTWLASTATVRITESRVTDHGFEYRVSPQNVDDVVKKCFYIPRDADFKLYTYGLNFAGNRPPHLAGFTLAYIEKDGLYKSGLPVHFVPRAGYDQPVYEIIRDGSYMPSLKSESVVAWGLTTGTKQPAGSTGYNAFWFSFMPPPSETASPPGHGNK